MTDLWIYARTVPSKSKLQRMVRKASELGYRTPAEALDGLLKSDMIECVAAAG